MAVTSVTVAMEEVASDRSRGGPSRHSMLLDQLRLCFMSVSDGGAGSEYQLPAGNSGY